MKISLQRVYDNNSIESGYRILVDRLWPRGIKKDELNYDLWTKDFAPSNDLRKWFDHDSNKWDEFKKKYLAELDLKLNEIKELFAEINHEDVVFLYSAKDKKHNNAFVLKMFVENKVFEEM